MDAAEVCRIYDEDYAAIYDESFLLGPHFRECTEFENSLIGSFLRHAQSWLDVACGTGYFLSRFPTVHRCGLDIAPAMLQQAARANPGVCLVEGDYREARPEWHGQWELVSCMWYAYCYAGSVSDVETVVRNLAGWTATGGTCFLPVCDPDVLCKTKLPYRPPADSDDGFLEVTAIVWNWIDEPSGRRHTGLVAPHLDHLVALFESVFEEVEVLVYPAFQADCLQSRKAIVARMKRVVIR
jgi:SAM-dependent methyltransferase